MMAVGRWSLMLTSKKGMGQPDSGVIRGRHQDSEGVAVGRERQRIAA